MGFVGAARGATVYRYTGILQFTLNKYCIAIHFWLYRYTSLPYVTSSQFLSKFCKKISIIGFEISRNLGRFHKPEAVKRRGKKDAVVYSWHKLTQTLTVSNSISPSFKHWKCWFCMTDINASHSISFMDILHIFYSLFKLFPHFKYQGFIGKTCTYLFVLQILPTVNSCFRF